MSPKKELHKWQERERQRRKTDNKKNERGNRVAIWKCLSLPLFIGSSVLFSSSLFVSSFPSVPSYFNFFFLVFSLSFSAFLEGSLCVPWLFFALLPSDVQRPCHRVSLSKERKERPLATPDLHLVSSALKLFYFYFCLPVAIPSGEPFACIYLYERHWLPSTFDRFNRSVRRRFPVDRALMGEYSTVKFQLISCSVSTLVPRLFLLAPSLPWEYPRQNTRFHISGTYDKRMTRYYNGVCAALLINF